MANKDKEFMPSFIKEDKTSFAEDMTRIITILALIASIILNVWLYADNISNEQESKTMLNQSLVAWQNCDYGYNTYKDSFENCVMEYDKLQMECGKK